jgi:hypothetical protein
MIYRLLYVSTAEPQLNNAALERLVETAQRRNAALDITGLMVFTGSHFMQLLEGPRDGVEAVFHMICQDKRHSAIARLIAEEVAERSCPDWSMAMRVIESANDGPDQVFTVDDHALENFLPDAMAPELRVLFQSFNTIKRPAHIAAE